MTGWLYRVRQFRQALNAKPSSGDMAEVRQALPTTLYALFTRLQPSEKAHAIQVYRRVKTESSDPDLLIAALMHDIGKIMQPLKTWERALIVLVQNSFLEKWLAPPAGESTDDRQRGWLRALIVAEKHPVWGAQLVRKAGASPVVVRLIRRHQDALSQPPENREEELLRILQTADNLS